MPLNPAKNVLANRFETSGSIKFHALKTVAILANQLIEALDVDFIRFD